jgi:hypothetical protein
MKSAPPSTESLNIYPDRLKFVLKGFVRKAWSSAAAERSWSSRFLRVRAAVRRVEWMSVVRGLRGCALLQVPSHELESFAKLWAAHGLAWRRLNESSPRIGAWWLDADLPFSSEACPMVVGREPENAAFEAAWEVGNHERIGELLGYPPCCRSFFEEVAIAQRCVDTVWAMSSSEQHMQHRASGRLADGPAASNILLQSLGIRAIAHCPCSFRCRDTLQLAEALNSVAAEVGHEEEYGWLACILSWPAEWSALHGIAEIRTPVLKICIPTDATASEYVVRWKGSSLPAEAARGLDFPYKVSGHSPAVIHLDSSKSR